MIHVIIVGPSGAGKTTLQRCLVGFNFKAVNSYTTRPMRATETENDPYHFVDNREFDLLTDNGDLGLIRSYRVANGETWKYGFPVADLRNTDMSVSVLDPSGYLEIRDMVDDIYGIYMDIRDDERKYRLITRGDRMDEIERRMESDREDFKYIHTHFQELFNLRIHAVRKTSEDAQRVIDYLNKYLETRKNHAS